MSYELGIDTAGLVLDLLVDVDITSAPIVPGTTVGLGIDLDDDVEIVLDVDAGVPVVYVVIGIPIDDVESLDALLGLDPIKPTFLHFVIEIGVSRIKRG